MLGVVKLGVVEVVDVEVVDVEVLGVAFGPKLTTTSMLPPQASCTDMR
jgi:hypothetical protein